MEKFQQSLRWFQLWVESGALNNAVCHGLCFAVMLNLINHEGPLRMQRWWLFPTCHECGIMRIEESADKLLGNVLQDMKRNWCHWHWEIIMHIYTTWFDASGFFMWSPGMMFHVWFYKELYFICSKWSSSLLLLWADDCPPSIFVPY